MTWLCFQYGDDEDEDDDLYDDQILDDGTSGYFRFVMDSEGNPQLVPDEVSDYSEDDDEEEESMEEEDDEEEDEEEGDGASGSPQAQPINLSSSSNSFMSGHNQEMEQLFNRLRERNIPVDRYLRQAERLLRRYGGIRDEVADEEEEGEEAEETEQVETTGAESHDQSIANGTVSPPRSENAEDEGDEIGFTDFAGDIC